MIYQENSNSNDKLTLLKNDRDKLVKESFLTKIEEIWQLNGLALTAYKSGLDDFVFETFKMAFDLLSKPYDFYECYDLLKTLNQTDFSVFTDELSEVLYSISENCEGDLNNKLLLKLKLFEFSNSNFRDKLDSEILAILFNHDDEYRVNNSLSDSLPVFINYLIMNKSIEMAKGILIKFKEYLIEIIDLMIFENKQCYNPVNLKDFYQIITQEDIGIKKYSELELLICKL